MSDRATISVLLLGTALGLSVACGGTQAEAPKPSSGSPTVAPTPAAGVTSATASPPAGATSAQVLANGTFVKAPDQPAIFVIRDGKRRAFPDMDTFVAWGGRADGSNVVQLSREQLDAIPADASVPAGSRP